jgi:hypothetical protein
MGLKACHDRNITHRDIKPGTDAIIFCFLLLMKWRAALLRVQGKKLFSVHVLFSVLLTSPPPLAPSTFAL